MPKISSIRVSLRYNIVRAVKELLETGEYHTEKEALYYIISKKPKLTGFSTVKEKAYNQYMQFKFKNKNKL